MVVICQYCKQPAELSTGDREFPNQSDLARRRFWVCRPCEARVGCRGDTDVPLGDLGDGKLRAARQRCHEAFDPLWREMSRRSGMPEAEARNVAYTWLADQLGIEREDCLFGGMAYEAVLMATLICRGMLTEFERDRGTSELF